MNTPETKTRLRTAPIRIPHPSERELDLASVFLPLTIDALEPLCDKESKSYASLIGLKEKLLTQTDGWMIPDHLSEKKPPPLTHMVRALLPIDWSRVEGGTIDFDRVISNAEVKFLPIGLLKAALNYLQGDLTISREQFLNEYTDWIESELTYALSKGNHTRDDWNDFSLVGKSTNLYRASASGFTAADAIYKLCVLTETQGNIRERSNFIREAHRYQRSATTEGTIPLLASYDAHRSLFDKTPEEDRRLFHEALYSNQSPIRKAFERFKAACREEIEACSPHIVSPKLIALEEHIRRRLSEPLESRPSYIITAGTEISARHIFDFLQKQLADTTHVGYLLLSKDPEVARTTALANLDSQSVDFFVTTGLEAIPCGLLHRETLIAALDQQRTKIIEYPWVSELKEDGGSVVAVTFAVKGTADTFRRENVRGKKKLPQFIVVLNELLIQERERSGTASEETYLDEVTKPTTKYLTALIGRIESLKDSLTQDKVLLKEAMAQLSDLYDYGRVEVVEDEFFGIYERQFKRVIKNIAADIMKTSFDRIDWTNLSSQTIRADLVPFATSVRLLWRGVDFPDKPTRFDIIVHEIFLKTFFDALKNEPRLQGSSELPRDLVEFLHARIDEAAKWSEKIGRSEDSFDRATQGRFLRLSLKLEKLKASIG